MFDWLCGGLLTGGTVDRVSVISNERHHHFRRGAPGECQALFPPFPAGEVCILRADPPEHDADLVVMQTHRQARVDQGTLEQVGLVETRITQGEEEVLLHIGGTYGRPTLMPAFARYDDVAFEHLGLGLRKRYTSLPDINLWSRFQKAGIALETPYLSKPRRSGVDAMVGAPDAQLSVQLAGIAADIARRGDLQEREFHAIRGYLIRVAPDKTNAPEDVAVVCRLHESVKNLGDANYADLVAHFEEFGC